METLPLSPSSNPPASEAVGGDATHAKVQAGSQSAHQANAQTAAEPEKEAVRIVAPLPDVAGAPNTLEPKSPGTLEAVSSQSGDESAVVQIMVPMKDDGIVGADAGAAPPDGAMGHEGELSADSSKTSGAVSSDSSGNIAQRMWACGEQSLD